MKAIFTFHSIDDQHAVLSYPPDLLDYLLRILAQMNVPIVPIDNLLDERTQAGVALTFDDGMMSIHANAMSILENYGARAHVYVTSQLIGSKDLWPIEPGVGQYSMMGWDEIAELQAAGFIIDAHTRTHPDMRVLSNDQLFAECEDSDSRIEEMTGRKPNHFAYPFGYHNASLRDYISQRYKTAVSTEFAYLDKVSNRAAIPRLDSYYFRSVKSIDRLGSLLSRESVRVRSLLRDINKSQCRASCH